jgi:hypothetical protein
MFEDRYGLPVTTTSAHAFALYTESMDRALALRGGAPALLEEATRADEGFALALALQGLQRRAAGDVRGGTALIKQAWSRSDGVTPREASQLEVLGLFGTGRYDAARAKAIDHLDTWPADAIVLMQTHYLFNLFSTDPRRRAQHYDVVAAVAEKVGTDWYYLGELGFAAEEDGRLAEARELAEASLEARPDNGSAAHALAHVYLETADLRHGDEWLSTWLGSWNAPSEFACHLTWHLALLRLAEDRLVDRDVEAVLSFVGRSISGLPDGASLLWRLHLAGASNLPWDTLVLPPNPPGFSHGDYHRAFVLAGLDDGDGLQDWSDRLHDLDHRGHPSAGLCALVVEAIGWCAADDWARAADRLLELEPRLPALGGSRAQLEVLDDTTIEALRRAGRVGEARQRLDRRIAARPTPRDQHWRTQL